MVVASADLCDSVSVGPGLAAMRALAVFGECWYLSAGLCAPSHRRRHRGLFVPDAPRAMTYVRHYCTVCIAFICIRALVTDMICGRLEVWPSHSRRRAHSFIHRGADWMHGPILLAGKHAVTGFTSLRRTSKRRLCSRGTMPVRMCVSIRVLRATRGKLEAAYLLQDSDA